MELRLFSLQDKTSVSLTELLQMPYDLFERLESYHALKSDIEAVHSSEAQNNATSAPAKRGFKIINNGDGTGSVA